VQNLFLFSFSSYAKADQYEIHVFKKKKDRSELESEVVGFNQWFDSLILIIQIISLRPWP
jgi:hypothetical protein